METLSKFAQTFNILVWCLYIFHCSFNENLLYFHSLSFCIFLITVISL